MEDSLLKIGELTGEAAMPAIGEATSLLVEYIHTHFETLRVNEATGAGMIAVAVGMLAAEVGTLSEILENGDFLATALTVMRAEWAACEAEADDGDSYHSSHN